MQTILVIDDDESLRDTIGVMLEQEGFHAELAADGRSGYDRALALKPDLLLVDLRLPGMSGVDICRQLRAARAKTPIIVLSAVGDEVDKVLLLEIGADDYVVKPFGTRELLARIRATLRRVPVAQSSPALLQFGQITIDFNARTVTKAGIAAHLTPKELDVLTDLPAQLTLEEIAERHQVSLNTVKTHVRSIYLKLGAQSRRQAISSARRRGLL